MDVIELGRRASAATAAIIDRVPADRMDAPTPCARWTIREIVRHLVDNDRGHVAEARNSSTVDIGTEFSATSKVFTETFDDPAVLGRKFELAGIEVDGRAVVAVRFADVLVHGWDIGRAAGIEVRIDDDLAAAALRVTSAFPENLRGPDGAFDYPRPAPEDAPLQVRLLAFLGRDPEWTQRQAS